MKKTYTKKILFAFTLLWSILLFAQNNNQQIYVSYGNPAINIAYNSTVSFGSSTEIAFAITNVPDGNGNPSLVLSNPEVTLSNTNFVISSPPSSFNIKRGDVSVFKIRKNNFACSASPQSTIVTVHSNAKNYTAFTFIITFTNAPSISVLGGTPTQPVPNGQTNATSATGTLFGTVDVLGSATRSFVIVNTGTCPLTLNSLTCFGYNPITGLQSADFSIIVSPTPYPPTGAAPSNTIPPGGSSYIVVLFRPTSPGTKEAIISISSNDLTKNPYTFVVKGEGFNPNVTGPGGGNPDFRLWLKSTRGITLPSGSNKVSLWKDLGSTGKDATQSTVANQPTYIDATASNINFNPVVKFENNGSSVSQYLYNTDNGYYTHETYIVMEPDVEVNGTSSPMTIISGTSAPNPSFPLISGEYSGIGLGDFSSRLTGEKLWFNQWQTNATTPYFSVGDVSGNYTKAGIINTRNKSTTASAGVDLLFNTNLLGALTSSSTTYSNLGYLDTSVTPNIWKGTPYNIGKNINSGNTLGNLNGRVAEVISYASRVLDVNRPKIESYLAIKYGITLGINGTSSNYFDSAGTTIWNVINNTGYNYNIAGIGKDIGSDLNQKQSKSINEINEVTIGLGLIASTNNSNPNEFKNDRNFLVWGNDNGNYLTSGSTNTLTIGPGLNTTFTRINRKWKIVETVETNGDVENIFIGIPETAFSGFPKLADEEYVLIVADNANFANTDIIDVIPLKTIGGILQTWYDFDGTKFFTFGIAPKVAVKQAIKIDTADDFLVGEYALNLNSGSFTIGCWLKNSGSGNRTIMSKGANLELRLNAQHKVEAYWDGVLKFASNTPIGDGKWHNVVAVYYAGAADLYIDGVIESSTFNLQNPSPNFSRYSVGALYIDKNNIQTPFNGDIDEVNIWNRALTAGQINYIMNQEVEKHANSQVNGKVLPQSVTKNELNAIPWNELVAYYDYNSFYGTTVEGLTGDRNFLRIKYLNKDKQIFSPQTAPLPYETIADGAWSSPDTWKNGSSQTTPSDISIINNGKSVNGNIVDIKHNITSTGNKTVLGLFVQGTDATTYKTLSATNDSKVEISHYLKLDGLIDLKGRSQLVQTLNSDLDVTSKGFIKRDQQGTVNKFNYNYWSSPVGPINSSSNNNNYTVNGVFKSGTTASPVDINWISGYDGSTSPLSLARYWLFKFQNGVEYADWIHFNENDPLLPSQGFSTKGAGAVDLGNTLTQNYTFIGKPYNGLIEGNKVLTDNLFLVGNPYPSALDATEFIRDNISVANGGYNTYDVIDGTLYFWQHSPDNATHFLDGYTGGYATLTLVGSVGPEAPIGISGLGTASKKAYQYIPVGQGFFVYRDVSSITGTGSIVFNNNQRGFVKEDALDIDGIAPISNTLFKNSTVKNKNQKVDHFNDNSNDVIYNDYYTKIRLGFNTPNNHHRQLLIGFMNENASDGFDVGYDGYQLDTQDNDLYFLIDDMKYSIQGVGSFDVSKAYPLGVKTDTLGLVKFMIDETEFLPANQKIYIHDKTDSIFYDITKKPIEIKLAAGRYNSRFELTFKTDKSEIVEQNEIPESMLLIYNSEEKKKLSITKNQKVVINEVSIYNIVGQRIANYKDVSSLDVNTIEFPFNVQKGVYIVKVNTNIGIISKKILKD